MKKKVIIIPTFKNHFRFNKKFLESFQKHVRDKESVSLHFVLAEDEIDEFRKEISQFFDIKIVLENFCEILKKYGYKKNSNSLLIDLKKFSYQSLKKLLPLQQIEYEEALILDSEALLIKDVNIADIFDQETKHKTVFYSDLDHRKIKWEGSLSDNVNKSVSEILNIKLERYYLEYFGWFYIKKYVDKMFEFIENKHGTNILNVFLNFAKNEGHIFENILYYSYVIHVADPTEYKGVNIKDVLRDNLSADDYNLLIRGFCGEYEPCGILEHISKEITQHNLDSIGKIFTKLNLFFFRWESVSFNSDILEKFILKTPIAFLASSHRYLVSKYKVAVCISGMHEYPEQNISFLHAFLSNAPNADVFCAISYKEMDSKIATIVNGIRPKKYKVITKQPNFNLTPKLPEKNVKPSRDHGSYSMFYGIMEAFQLKCEYEAEQNISYDLVVRLRLDILPLKSLINIISEIEEGCLGYDKTIYVPNHFFSIGINDQFAISTNENMAIYSNLYQNLKIYSDDENVLFNPEYLMYHHLKKNGISVKLVNFEYLLLRDKLLNITNLENIAKNQITTYWSSYLQEQNNKKVKSFIDLKNNSTLSIAKIDLLEKEKGYYLVQSDYFLDSRSPKIRYLNNLQLILEFKSSRLRRATLALSNFLRKRVVKKLFLSSNNMVVFLSKKPFPFFIEDQKNGSYKIIAYHNRIKYLCRSKLGFFYLSGSSKNNNSIFYLKES